MWVFLSSKHPDKRYAGQPHCRSLHDKADTEIVEGMFTEGLYLSRALVDDNFRSDGRILVVSEWYWVGSCHRFGQRGPNHDWLDWADGCRWWRRVKKPGCCEGPRCPVNLARHVKLVCPFTPGNNCDSFLFLQSLPFCLQPLDTHTIHSFLPVHKIPR